MGDLTSRHDAFIRAIMGNQAIIALHNKFPAASLLAMKYSALQNQLKELIPTILDLAKGGELNLQNRLAVRRRGCLYFREQRLERGSDHCDRRKATHQNKRNGNEHLGCIC